MPVHFGANSPKNFIIYIYIATSWFRDVVICKWSPLIKESYSTANEGKRQFNRLIIYYLNIVPMVNDSFCRVNEKKKKKNIKNVHSRGLNSRRMSVPLKSDALTIEPSKLQNVLPKLNNLNLN